VIRIGVLGAARIVPPALTRPARMIAGVTVAAIAARDPVRARQFARRHRIPRVHRTYASLIADPTVDAVYIPLPNSLHAEWTIRALDAGKHVLCEKPFASNAAEAERMAGAAQRTGRVLMEAFAYRYHPMADRLPAILASGAIGVVRRYEADFFVPIVRPNDIRWRFDLAGGSLMDAGCYPVSLVRWLAGAEPSVRSAAATLARPNVDRSMTAELLFADGRTARIRSSLLSTRLFRSWLRVTGDGGSLTVINPYHPSWGNLVIVRNRDGRHAEIVRGGNHYLLQLRAFAAAIRGDGENRTHSADSVATMRVVDAIYQAAGLSLRGV
jgi:predicted dehydrogenase